MALHMIQCYTFYMNCENIYTLGPYRLLCKYLSQQLPKHYKQSTVVWQDSNFASYKLSYSACCRWNKDETVRVLTVCSVVYGSGGNHLRVVCQHSRTNGIAPAASCQSTQEWPLPSPRPRKVVLLLLLLVLVLHWSLVSGHWSLHGPRPTSLNSL